MSLAERIPVFAAALWWGGTTAICFIAVPVLFASMPTPAVAGQAAAQLFKAQAWMAVLCALVLMIRIRVSGRYSQLGWVVGGALLALLVELAVAPRIVARENLALWHSLGSAMIALQWICAGAALWSVSRPAS